MEKVALTVGDVVVHIPDPKANGPIFYINTVIGEASIVSDWCDLGYARSGFEYWTKLL